VLGNKPPNLSEEEVRRWHVGDIILLDKEEIEKCHKTKLKQKYLNWEHNSFSQK
jgi:hypothetical protein